MKKLLLEISSLLLLLLAVSCESQEPSVNTTNLPDAPEDGTTFVKSTKTVKGVSFDMIYIPAGRFMVKNNYGKGHYVKLTGYEIATTEVTQELYQAVMGENPSYFKGPQLPVDSVSWDDAYKFCQQLSKLTGKKYSLPSEAQWMYAARSCKHFTDNSWSYIGQSRLDEEMDLYVWSEENSERKTHPVATKLPNSIGLYDMSGNVAELCLDWYGEDLSTQEQTNPTGPEKGEYHVKKGGSIYDYSPYMLSPLIKRSDRDRSDEVTGFRIVRIP